MSTGTALQNWTVYQPLIVGLGAVVLGLIGNTLLEWYRLHLKDSREARTIRRAFAEELKIHRWMYGNALSSDQRAETEGGFLIRLIRLLQYMTISSARLPCSSRMRLPQFFARTVI